MGTIYFKGSGIQPNTALPSVQVSASEAAAWPYFSSYAATKEALWVECASSRYYRKLGAADAPALAKIIDRCGDRVFTTDTVRLRHPIIVTDSITGRPVMQFGAGGTSPNALSTSVSGMMTNASILNSSNAEINALSLMKPAVGWSVAAKVRVPTPSTVANGVSFGSTVGGTILGGAGLGTSPNENFTVQISTSAGTIRGFNQIGITTSGQWFQGSGDLRDGTWHDVIVTWNPTTSTMSGWIDGTAQTPVTTVTTDISSTAACQIPMLGGIGDNVSGNTQTFVGFIAFVAFLPTPVLATDGAARTAIRALMATK